MIKILISHLLFFTFLFGNINPFDDCVNFTSKLDRDKYFIGENLYLTLDVNIKDGYHIYSTNPEKSLASSYIDFKDSTIFSIIGIINEPITNSYYDENFKQQIHYHKDNIQFVQNLKISEDMKIGKHMVEATFEYYACDPTKCIPMYDDFSFVFEIFEGDKREKYIQPIAVEYSGNDETGNVSFESLDEVINKGFISFILFSISMGFLALLTPCVFPMIPITVSYFTKEGEKKGNNPVKNALIYALGIIIIFTCLGLLLSFTIGASGAGDLAANPWVNLFIGFLFIFFAFSLFGFYEIQIPSSITQYSLKLEGSGGTLGILFMSLTFTLTSFTCTVAFVGALLAAASTGEYFWPIIGMVSFSTAFSSPFFLLALFPQYLSKLPKSGGWLNSIKVIMGFLELAAAFKFISNTDLVWEWGIFNRDVVLLIWAVIFIAIFVYMLSNFIKSVNKNYYGFLFGVISFVFGIYLFSGLFGNKIHGLIESYLPPESSSMEWIENLDEAFEIANKDDKLIFIDFTGYTCTNCRWMEINIFELPEVKKKFEEYVLVKLYTDGKDPIHAKNRQMEIERFKTAALPFYVILNAQDEVISTFPGMDTNKQNFIDFLTNASENF